MSTIHSSPVHFIPPPGVGLTGQTIVATDNVGNSAWQNIPTSSFQFVGIPGTSQLAVGGVGYIIDNPLLTTVTLPAIANEGVIVAIQGKGSGGWILQANVGQIINIGSVPTSPGGTVASSNQWDSIQVVCVVANTTWAMFSAVTQDFTIL
jgi:hypothetical protein